MNVEIENTLRSHYGVTDCTISNGSEQNTIEVYCVGGNIDYIKIALIQLCDVDEKSVELIDNKDNRALFRVTQRSP